MGSQKVKISIESENVWYYQQLQLKQYADLQKIALDVNADDLVVKIVAGHHTEYSSELVTLYDNYYSADAPVGSLIDDGKVTVFVLSSNMSSLVPDGYDDWLDSYGSSPDGFTNNDGANCDSTVERSYKGNKDVIQQADANAAASCQIYSEKSYGLALTVFASIDDNTKQSGIVFYTNSGATYLGVLYPCNNAVAGFHNGVLNSFGTISTDEWYEVTAIFHTNNVDIYIDREYYETYALVSALVGSTIDKVKLQTSDAMTGYNAYYSRIRGWNPVFCATLHYT
jgi:hypothetical protein